LSDLMKPSRIYFLVAIIFFSSACFAQESAEMDSLKKEAMSLPDDTNKVNTLIIISGEYLGSDVDQALKYANEANDLADKIKFRDGKAWALKKIGQVYNIKGDYVNALQVWK